MTEYPYMVSNNKIAPIFEKIKSAAIPPKFTTDFLRRLGFTSTNDRAFIPLMKKLDFLTEDGVPTDFYNQLKDDGRCKKVIADRILNLYAELYSLDTRLHKASDVEMKGAFGRVTGKDEATIARYLSTFKALLPLADFDSKTTLTSLVEKEKPEDNEKPLTNTNEGHKQPLVRQELVNFHYNIQIHLPSTSDINVYNAIFKSIKENLTD